MATEKLTLSVDPGAIANGKRYAASTGRSLSSIVGDYLASLGTHGDAPLSAPVERLMGIARNGRTDESDYRRHLEEKYL